MGHDREREAAAEAAKETGETQRTFAEAPRPPSPFALLPPDPDAEAADPARYDRALGCLLGLVAGDSLGSLVEFEPPDRIAAAYPHGLTELADGGTWGTLAGQPTDDSEMALMLARATLAAGRYDLEATARAYAAWYDSAPFDMGGTTASALGPASRAMAAGRPAADAARAAAARNPGSQANGALMRVAPLAVYGHALAADDLAALARSDAALTHASAVCADANVVFCLAVAAGVRGATPREMYGAALAYARDRDLEPAVTGALVGAETAPPQDFLHHQGWVLIALRNAFFRLLHAPSLRDAVVDTVAAGGDTDTNGAIAGALLGAARGAGAVPHTWADRVLGCRARPEVPGCRHPRPEAFWAVDLEAVAARLVALGARAAEA